MNLETIRETIEAGFRQGRMYNLTGSSAAFLLAACDEPLCILERTEERARELANDINFYRSALRKEPVSFITDPDGPGRAGERALFVSSLTAQISIVSSLHNLRAFLWSPETLRLSTIHLATGIEMDRSELEKRLHRIGYRSVTLVTEKGEWSGRGWLFDIFPSTSDAPLRIEFIGDEIESMKFFDVETQRSTSDIPSFSLFPAADAVSGTTLLDLIGERRCLCSDSVADRADIPGGTVFFSEYSVKGEGFEAGTLPIKGLGILPEERKNIDELPRQLRLIQREKRVVMVASSKSQAARIRDILSPAGIIAPIIELRDMFSYEGLVSIVIGALSAGLHLPDILILTERELFGARPPYKHLKRSKVSQLLASLGDLSPGDFVVHKDHGIGRFTALINRDVEGVQEDLMVIEYDGGRLHLPLQGIAKISKYHAEEGFAPKIDRLGGKTWQRTKEKVELKIRQLAEKLISLHARREVQRGFSFSPDTELHREFDSFFPYEETPDQIKASEEIKRDMESDRPMDRLLCGDVGFGKTEVAMRAAFRAVYDGFQVAVLVPTTILCEQHYRTFLARFSAFPVRIDYLSRFKSRREKDEVVRSLARGDIDIVIGTHSLLGTNISFHKLGLLVIDEEHKFGVAQKERIKELKTGVDVLTLTATPIPRTLSMALSDIRAMSVIETPPEERLAVKTVVSRFDKELIREAIGRERERNGQTFFVHNRIQNIHEVAAFIRELFPSLTVEVAHGQMDGRRLEKVMLDFYRHAIDVLVSTAIVGAGLDVPNANTIIVNRADTMGLADLYQLRGRVGRSNVRAYAYFLVPGDDAISGEAHMRLQAIQEMSYLGAGFRLALKDLEIRGAGNLLGAEQSGHIHAVGFDLYMEMLERAVAELQGSKIEEEFETAVRVQTDAFIPEAYIDDTTVRLGFYRRIASARTHESVEEILSEMEDRFGPVPAQASHLADIMKLKISARDLMITKILERGEWVRFEFSPQMDVHVQELLSLDREKKEGFRFLPNGFEMALKDSSWEERRARMEDVIEQLKKSSALLVS